MDPLFPTIGNVDEIKVKQWSPLRGIKLQVCRKHGITVEEFDGAQRGRKIVAIRLEAIRLAKATGASSPAIGKAYNRDHSTILHALRKTPKYAQTSKSSPVVES